VYDAARNDWVDGAEDFMSAVLAPTTSSPTALPASAFSDPVDLSAGMLFTLAFANARSGNSCAAPPRVGEPRGSCKVGPGGAVRAFAVCLTRSELRPIPKGLVAKRSKRCKQCEHNLVKPELSPTSIKFKMQLFAL
jgi:hypothetical protein